jgi:hypothetical protein
MTSVHQIDYEHRRLPETSDRNDFLALALQKPHHGIIIVIRRRTRAAERAALYRLLERAGSAGLQNNINFA